MAPKNMPPTAKQAKIVEYFKESMNVFTLKELEKLLPGVASINQMQVKEYLQSLQDEYAIRVEKIGSGNWYWCFGSDAKVAKENIINTLKAEESKLQVSIAETEKQIEEVNAKRKDDDEMLEGTGADRQALLRAQEVLQKEEAALDRELAAYSDNDPTEVLRKIEETKMLKTSAVLWTENIETLEQFLVKKLGDRGHVARLMQHACGEEYIAGEGLKEL